MSSSTISTAPTSAAQAEEQAEQLRKDLAGTIDQLKDNLRPSQLANEAWTRTRAHTPDWLERYWLFAQSPVGLALIGAAGVSIAGGLLARRQIARR